jgi:histidine ammonia-lyase
MLPQTTAAALVATNRQLAMPSSVDSLPTCEDQEDHVAMSTTAARRAEEVLGNVWKVLAIELLTAARGVRRRMEHGQGAPGRGTSAALSVVGEIDGPPGVAIEHLARRLALGELVDAVEAIVPLQGVAHG